MGEQLSLGVISDADKKEIELIYKKKIALESLVHVIANTGDTDMDEKPVNSVLYDNLINDLGDALFNMQDWWKRMSSKHNWSFDEQNKWGVDFTTNEVFIIRQAV